MTQFLIMSGIIILLVMIFGTFFANKERQERNGESMNEPLTDRQAVFGIGIVIAVLVIWGAALYDSVQHDRERALQYAVCKAKCEPHPYAVWPAGDCYCDMTKSRP